jgi:hypothetical protein
VPADDPNLPEPLGHPNVFRAPTAREHRMAAGLFIGLAVAFLLLFVVLEGWWFRWVVAGLAVWSLLVGFRHGLDARRLR